MTQNTLTQARPELERSIKWEATNKQQEALAYLNDDFTEELLFGGAAGGAKSFLGCGWLIVNCYNYPGSRWLMGRAVLKQLKQSTLLTFFEVCSKWKIRANRDYIYNENQGIITFVQNGSQIYLKDLMYYPSDPDYDSLGSTEYTGAFIDEASQIRESAKNVVRSRLRYKLNEFKLKPKLLMTCNPTKNFLYGEFYKPWKEGKLPMGKAFIVSRVEDNPFIPEAYIRTLHTLDKTSQERLLKGNWEYDDDPATLMDYDAIMSIFTNEVEGQDPGRDGNGDSLPDMRKRYIVCDVARLGDDRTVITVWYGWECKHVFTYKKSRTTTTAKLLLEKARHYGVPMSHVLVDEDGVGGGVVDQLYGCKGFIANSRPFRKENYQNLKAQCAYALRDMVNSRQMAVRMENPDLKQSLVEELEQVKAHNLDKDTKLAIVPKEIVKEALGRSPDIGDCLMMRMYFMFKPTARLTFVKA